MTDRPPPLPPWVDRDDLEQVLALARIEAETTGFNPDRAASEARAAYLRTERARLRREAPASSVCPVKFAGLEWVTESRKVVGLAPPKSQTAKQRQRFLRNQLILAGALAGFSQRQLGEVFDLPHSQIGAILDELKGKLGLSTSRGTPPCPIS